MLTMGCRQMGGKAAVGDTDPEASPLSLVVAIFLPGEDLSCGGPDDPSHPPGLAGGGTHRGFNIQGYHSLGWWFGILFVGKETLPRNPAPIFADPILRFVLVKSWKLELKTALEITGHLSSDRRIPSWLSGKEPAC